MAIPRYLAMTASEFQSAGTFPEKTAWMACHFSPYSTGLTNLPSHLPPDSLLILNDRMPPNRHDAKRIAETLQEIIQEQQCSGLLLDFQRPGCAEAANIAATLAELPCPIAVTEAYAMTLHCPVFLSPVPLNTPLREYIAPWQGREIWLEIALDAQKILITPKGAEFEPLPGYMPSEKAHEDKMLHCHYTIGLENTSAEFMLYRTHEDVAELLEDAGQLGIKQAVGLYQELGINYCHRKESWAKQESP